MRTLAEQIDLETRTRTLNPKWFEGMLKHGYEGVRHIEGHVTNTLGWSATTGRSRRGSTRRSARLSSSTKTMRRRLSELNPKSPPALPDACSKRATASCGSPTRPRSLPCSEATDELEDRLEGVFAAE